MLFGPNGQPIQGPFPAKMRPKISHPFGEIRDWRKVGKAQYHSSNHPTQPWDTEAVRLFREEVDPTMVPLWVRNTYRNVAGGVYVFDRHVITAYDPKRKRVHPDLRGITASADGHSPNWIVEILGDRGGVLPGPFIAFGMFHFYKYKELTDCANHENVDENNREYLQGRLAKIAARDKEYQERADYRWDQDWGYLMRLRDKLSSEERELIAQSIQRVAPGIH